MIVCLCNAIRETELRSAIRRGAACPLTAYALLGRRAKCGQCFPFARQIVSEERSALSIEAA